MWARRMTPVLVLFAICVASSAVPRDFSLERVPDQCLAGRSLSTDTLCVSKNTASTDRSKCDLGRCLEMCERAYDVDKCVRLGGGRINCQQSFKKCQLNCTSKCQ